MSTAEPGAALRKAAAELVPHTAIVDTREISDVSVEGRQIIDAKIR